MRLLAILLFASAALAAVGPFAADGILRHEATSKRYIVTLNPDVCRERYLEELRSVAGPGIVVKTADWTILNAFVGESITAFDFSQCRLISVNS